MLKKTITYDDFEGESVVEDFHFHLSEAELVEFNLSEKGGLEEYIRRMGETDDGATIMQKFKQLIAMSVGKRSEDGKRFSKSEDITNGFMETGAYSGLFVELLSDSDAGSDFVNGLMPANMRKKLAEATSNLEGTNPIPEINAAVDKNLESRSAETEVPVWELEGRNPTVDEFKKMTPDQQAAAFAKRL